MVTARPALQGRAASINHLLRLHHDKNHVEDRLEGQRPPQSSSSQQYEAGMIGWRTPYCEGRTAPNVNAERDLWFFLRQFGVATSKTRGLFGVPVGPAEKRRRDGSRPSRMSE
jgi:hypothetical protein